MSKLPCSVQACERPARSRGYCASHYQFWHKFGYSWDEHDRPEPPDPLDVYWSRVDRSGGPDACWPWTATVDANGYGIFCTGGKKPFAHRWGYEARIGAIPLGHSICHRCDNPPCQNDRHWFTGTQRDNNLDKVAKGRQRNVRGTQHYAAKLTEPSVAEIRARHLAGNGTNVELAAEYGVTPNAIRMLLMRRTWKHVP